VRYLTTSASLAAVLLAATACGGDGDLADASECDGGPEVKVSDAGSEPRRMMELAPTVGDSVALDMRMDMEIDATVDGESAPTQPIPPIELGMRMTVEDVSEDEIELSFVYDQVHVDDPTLQGTLSTIVDSSGTIVTTRNGAYVDGEFEAAPGMDPAMAATADQLEQQLADMTIPLPSEPVGTGAEWEVESSLELNGVAFCNSYTYRLVEFDGDSYKLETDMEQRPVEGSAVETAGATVEVVDGSGHATGTSSGSLSLPIAVTASVQADSDMEMSVEAGGDEVTQEVSTSIAMELDERV
jgi:hypothetical protein